jgi:hypothetical protein
MALTKISASVIAANAIVAAGVAENSISTSEIATDGVGTLQISDGAVTSGKLETNIDIAGTLDVTGVLTADSNVVIAGNLTVNGATVTNSSTNTTIADALIELGTGTTGSPANDAGIVIERGDSDNAFIGWDESADTFILGTGSFTGASTGNLTISTAPLSVGTLTASGITFPTSDGSSGQVLKTDGSGNLTFDAQTAVVDNFTATGDGSTTDFDTGINPGDEVNTWVFIDGVYQQKGEYSYSGSTISFSTAPDSGATIDVTTGTVGGFASADSVLGVYETTTTNTDTYTTGISASNENNTWVFVGGVYQPKDSYTFSSGTLTFDANTPTGQKLSVTATKSLSAGSVETNSITANAVTSAKIASNSILSRHIANNSIVGADISATTQITASTFTGALTGDVTGNVVGNLTGTIQTAAQTNITSVGTLSALTVSGQLTAGGLAYPTSDGTNEQVLQTDGSGNLSFGTVSGTTINNNTNNYVMTGTGTANTLNGESGLTYDGTNLGIGTTSPTTFSGYVSVHHKNTAGDAIHLIESDGGIIGQTFVNDASGVVTTGARSNHPWRVTTNDTERLRVDTSGNVGIGVSPSYKFHISGTSGSNILRVQDTGNNAGLGIGADSTDGAEINYGGVDILRFVNVSTERMRIDSSGNVGIGQASDGDKLHVLGTGFFEDARGNGVGVQINGGSVSEFAHIGVSASNPLTFQTADTERMRIASNGGVSVSNDGQMGYTGSKFHVKGTAFTTSDSSGNAKGGFSTFSGSKDITNSATTIFTINRDNGAHSGFVIITKSESGDSASAIYSWASNYNNTPDLDLLSSATAVYTGFTLSASQSNATITFKLTHGASGTKNYTYTVIYGGSRQSGVTVTLY